MPEPRIASVRVVMTLTDGQNIDVALDDIDRSTFELSMTNDIATVDCDDDLIVRHRPTGRGTLRLTAAGRWARRRHKERRAVRKPAARK